MIYVYLFVKIIYLLIFINNFFKVYLSLWFLWEKNIRTQELKKKYINCAYLSWCITKHHLLYSHFSFLLNLFFRWVREKKKKYNNMKNRYCCKLGFKILDGQGRKCTYPLSSSISGVCSIRCWCSWSPCSSWSSRSPWWGLDTTIDTIIDTKINLSILENILICVFFSRFNSELN